MNIKILYPLILILTISLSSATAGNRESTPDTLTMGPGYANDLFYSMSDGLVASVDRAGWDLGFYTSAFSAGVIINEGAGVQLFSYPNGDTTEWATLDTTGLSSWKSVVNSPEVWEDGAFNRGALGHPDYGWGIYNMVTHSLKGDSLYVINLPEVGYKKLWIVDKISVDNMYHLRYANLDGSNEQNVAVDASPYTSKNFVYFSMTTEELIDREPEGNWDLLFTKYFDFTYDNEGNAVEYLVTGVTSNVNKFTSKYTEVGSDYDDWSAQAFDSLKNVVGYDWKSFSMATFSWEVDDSTCFFVQNDLGDVYKLVFTMWEGSSTGVFALNKMMVSANSINDKIDATSSLKLYPNPATDVLNISMDIDINVDANITVTDISGRVLYNQSVNNLGASSLRIETSNFSKGLYFVTIESENIKESAKFLVR